MKNLLLTFVLLFTMAVFATNAIAQSQTSTDVSIQQVDREVSVNNNSFYLSDELSGVFTNSAFIGGLQQLAIDANQVARINTTGDSNTATLTQSGNFNIGVININGSNNNASLNQTGSRLFSTINMEGNFNDLDVSQNGSDLQNFILLEGRGLNFDIAQTADGGVQLSQSGSSIPLMMKTSSGSVPIIIRNN